MLWFGINMVLCKSMGSSWISGCSYGAYKGCVHTIVCCILGVGF